MRQYTRENGYTLIELLVVIGILAVVAGIAAPVTVHAVRSAETHSDTYRLVALLRQLQDQATSRQETIRITPSATGINISTGQNPALSNAASLQTSAPLVYYPDGTTSGGRLILRNGAMETDIEIAWLTGAIHVEDAP